MFTVKITDGQGNDYGVLVWSNTHEDYVVSRQIGSPYQFSQKGVAEREAKRFNKMVEWLNFYVVGPNGETY